MGKQSFKRWRWALPAILLCLCLYSCSAIFHEHEWQEATCAEARTCVGCGDREGEPLGHDWEEATCAAPKTCRRCGAVEGERIEHQWTPATCVEPELCVLCGQRQGEPLEHNPLNADWETAKEPTCQTEGERTNACSACGATLTESIPVIPCQAGDWEIAQQASAASEGVRIQRCVMCGAELERETYALTADIGNTEPSKGAGGNFNQYNAVEQQQTSANYVLNKSTKKVHKPSCRDVPKIAPKNYATSNESREALIAQGYSPCGHCHR